MKREETKKTQAVGVSRGREELGMCEAPVFLMKGVNERVRGKGKKPTEGGPPIARKSIE